METTQNGEAAIDCIYVWARIEVSHIPRSPAWGQFPLEVLMRCQHRPPLIVACRTSRTQGFCLTAIEIYAEDVFKAGGLGIQDLAS